MNGTEIDLTPPVVMREEARRGLEWREEHGRGGTDVGVRRARQLVDGDELSADDVVSIYAWKARHMVDREAEGWSPGEEGYPSAGRIAAALWGLPAGDEWVERKRAQIEDARNKAMNARRKTVTGYAKALGDRQVRVVASTSGMDRHGDMVVQEGINLENFRRSPVILYNHDTDHPIASAVDIRINDGRLEAVAQFPPEGTSEKSDEVYRLVKAGVISATSIGFTVQEAEPMDDGGMLFKRTELLEFSFVSVPANPEALVLERNFELASEIVREMRAAQTDTTDALEIVRQDITAQIEAIAKGAAQPSPDDDTEEDDTPAPEMAAIQARAQYRARALRAKYCPLAG